MSPQEEITAKVQAQFPRAQVEYLSVDPTQVLAHTDMAMHEGIDYLRETHNFELPLGSLVHQSSNTHALVKAPGASYNALIRLGFADFEAGTFTPILGQALGALEDYVIYEARASSQAIAWVECNMVHGFWRVYATLLADGTANEEIMQQAQLLDSGVGTHVPPLLAVSDRKVYWTVMPDPTGTASTEDSYLKAVDFSKSSQATGIEPQIVYTSHGRMITTPIVSGDMLTFVPRVDTGSVYYQLTTMDMRNDEIKNISILPPSVRVSDAVWLESGFAFGIEANYDYALGLSLFGTYLQLGNGQYLYVNKVPTSASLRMKSLTYVKSTKNVLGLDPQSGTAVIVGTLQDCVDYGDVLAGAGLQDRLVVFTTVTSRIGLELGRCQVRVFDPY